MSNKALFLIFSCLIVLATASEHGKHHKHSSVQKRTNRCGENERLANSGIDCLTCQNYTNTTCSRVNQRKCYCLDGYVRDPRNKCIRPEDCATACGYNERYINHTNPCDNTCAVFVDEPITVCYTNRTGTCACADGYTRCFTDFSCIPASDCYPKCGENEEASRDGCRPYCENNTVVQPDCSKYVQGCRKYCVCRSGYIRDNTSGICIPLDQCSNNATTVQA